jgi:hypothetical protein
MAAVHLIGVFAKEFVLTIAGVLVEMLFNSGFLVVIDGGAVGTVGGGVAGFLSIGDAAVFCSAISVCSANSKT